MEDVVSFAAWYFGTELAPSQRSTRAQMEALRCTYRAGRELGFTWNAIAEGVGRERTTCVYALGNGHQPSPEDVAAVIKGAKALAEAEVFQ